MKLGDIVQHKASGIYGTVEYSSFGYSIHAWVEFEGKLLLSKTVGMPARELLKHFYIVDLPEGYEVHKYGGLRKKVMDNE